MTAQKLLESLREAKAWMDSNALTSGKLDEKYGIMVFKAKKGNYSIMKRIVADYVIRSRKVDPDIMVMEDIDDDSVKTWLVGNPNKINQMVEDSLNSNK